VHLYALDTHTHTHTNVQSLKYTQSHSRTRTHLAQPGVKIWNNSQEHTRVVHLCESFCCSRSQLPCLCVYVYVLCMCVYMCMCVHQRMMSFHWAIGHSIAARCHNHAIIRTCLQNSVLFATLLEFSEFVHNILLYDVTNVCSQSCLVRVTSYSKMLFCVYYATHYLATLKGVCTHKHKHTH